MMCNVCEPCHKDLKCSVLELFEVTFRCVLFSISLFCGMGCNDSTDVNIAYIFNYMVSCLLFCDILLLY
jgi:hypothetical protein